MTTRTKIFIVFFICAFVGLYAQITGSTNINKPTQLVLNQETKLIVEAYNDDKDQESISFFKLDVQTPGIYGLLVSNAKGHDGFGLDLFIYANSYFSNECVYEVEDILYEHMDTITFSKPGPYYIVIENWSSNKTNFDLEFVEVVTKNTNPNLQTIPANIGDADLIPLELEKNYVLFLKEYDETTNQDEWNSHFYKINFPAAGFYTIAIYETAGIISDGFDLYIVHLDTDYDNGIYETDDEVTDIMWEGFTVKTPGWHLIEFNNWSDYPVALYLNFMSDDY